MAEVMGGVKVRTTVGFGQQLISYTLVPMPGNLGEDPFDAVMRHGIDTQKWRLHNLLKTYSPIYQEDRKKINFGPKHAWKSVDGGMLLLDWDAPIEMKFDEDCQDAAYWCLRLMLDPTSPKPGRVDIYDEIWEMADQLGAHKQLRKDLGLNKGPAKKFIRDSAKFWEEEDRASVKKLERATATKDNENGEE